MPSFRPILILLAVSTSIPAHAAVLRIGPSCAYTTLQAALDVAQPGDELRLVTGSQSVNATIQESDLSLRGGFASCSAGAPTLSDRTTLVSAAPDRPVVGVGIGVSGIVLERLVLTGADNPTAAGGMGEGGGLSLANGAVVAVSVVSIVDNTAGRGAGAFLAPGARLEGAAGLNTGVVFSGNVADQEGGAIYANLGASVDFSTRPPLSLVFEDNTAGWSGGAIYAGDQTMLSLVGAVFDGNDAETLGGAIHAVRGSLHLVDGEYRVNEAAYGGALAIRNALSATIEGGDFNANRATSRGGAIDAVQTDVPMLLRDSDPASEGLGLAPRFTANLSGSEGGGAIFYQSTAGKKFTIANAATGPVEFTGNTTTGDGGALRIVSAPVELAQNLLVVGNQAVNGGAVSASAFALVWLRADQPAWIARFEENVVSANGGAFHVIAGSQLVLDWARIGDVSRPNVATEGGAIHVDDATLDLRNSRVRSNLAASSGGGLHVGSHAYVRVNGVTGSGTEPGVRPLPRCQPTALPANRHCSEIAANRVTQALGVGGGVTAKYPDVMAIDHSALTDNEAWSGAAVYQWNASHVLLDTVLVSGHDGALRVGTDAELALQSTTIAGNEGNAISLADGAGTRLVTYDSILWGNELGIAGGAGATLDGDCNVTQDARIAGLVIDPSFVTTFRGDFRLSEFSVARDQCAAGMAVDLDGVARPNGFKSDAGAFEYVAFPDRLFADGFD